MAAIDQDTLDTRLKAVARTALAVEELDAATLKALAQSQMDPRHDPLDAPFDQVQSAAR